MAYENDPPEFTGRDRKVAADPKRAAPVASKSITAIAPPVEPAPAAVEKPGSHKKFAVVGPAKDYAAAMASTIFAREELQAATIALRIAEKAEGACLADFYLLNKPISSDQLIRNHLAASLAERAKRVEAGLDPEARAAAAPVVRSKLDQAARDRGRDRLSYKVASAYNSRETPPGSKSAAADFADDDDDDDFVGKEKRTLPPTLTLKQLREGNFPRTSYVVVPQLTRPVVPPGGSTFLG
jgi:hypothetical protein